MPSIYALDDPGEAWLSGDRMEAYVRYYLVENPGIFQSHFSESLPRIVATIPGKYDSQRGLTSSLSMDIGRCG